jgi:hypothetical protein
MLRLGDRIMFGLEYIREMNNRAIRCGEFMGRNVTRGNVPVNPKGRGRWQQLSSYCTTYDYDKGLHTVTYRETIIVQWTSRTVRLNTNGWLTSTTKRKMNQCSNQFNLGFGVYQKAHEWFVVMPDGVTCAYEDGMSFERTLAKEAE